MMRMVTIEVLNEKAGRPSGNPFVIRVTTDWLFMSHGCGPVHTGLRLGLPSDVDLRMASLVNGLYPVGWSCGDQFEILIQNFSDHEITVDCGEPLVSIEIVEKQLAAVRFVESHEGKRMIVGSPEKTVERQDSV